MTDAPMQGGATTWPTWQRGAVCLLVGLVLAWVQLAPQHDAWWGMQDDLVPLTYRAPQGTLRLADVPAVIATTEAVRFGQDNRYRPTYYITRVLEMWALGAHPRRWYVEHTVWYGLVIAAFAYGAWTFAGPWLAAGGIAWFVSAWYQRDIWAHLGTSEPYASLGAAAVVLGVCMGRRAGAGTAGLWLAALGTAYATGAKENFAILLVPTLLLAWHQRRAHPVAAVAASALATTAIAAVLLSVVMGLGPTPLDEYGGRIDAGTRLAWIASTTGGALALVWLAAAALLLPRYRALRDATTPADVARRSAIRDLVLLLIGLTLLVASQASFYGPVWPRFGSRYDYPGRLAEPLLLIGVALFVMRWLRSAGRVRQAQQVAIAAMLVGLGVAARHGVLPAREAARHNRENTLAIRARLTQARDAAAGAPLLVQVHGEAEYLEPGHAAVVLLAELGSRGPFLMRATPPEGPFAGSLKARLDAGTWIAGQRVRDPGDAAALGRHVVVTVNNYTPPDVEVVP